MRYATQDVESVAKAIKDDAAGNKQATMTDMDLAASMLLSLAKQRDQLQQENAQLAARVEVAESGYRAAVQTAQWQSRTNEDMNRSFAERMKAERERDQLLAALEVALSTLDDVQDNINPERGYADELESDVSSAIDIARSAIAAVKGGAV